MKLYSNSLDIAKRNIKVVENYFFMTALQVLNSLLGIIMYPYLIRVLGADKYGLYVFSLSFASYFVSFISFGFALPAMKAIVDNKADKQAINNVLSGVITAKLYLLTIALPAFITLLLIIPFLHSNWLILSICFSQVLSDIFFPTWYFQGVQKMKIATYFQFIFRVISLPFIFILIKSSADYCLYAAIVAAFNILTTIAAVIFLVTKEQFRYIYTPFGAVKKYFNDASPFFLASITGTLKQESIPIITGIFFGMKDVAIFDLANKIIMLPRMLTMNINNALFPKVMSNANKEQFRKIIRHETIIGVICIAGIVIFGYWAILILGGRNMTGAYPVAIILSTNVLTWLVVGCYNNFIFITHQKYYYITINQIIALFTFALICIPGLFLYQSILTLAMAFAISGFSELLFGMYMAKAKKYL